MIGTPLCRSKTDLGVAFAKLSNDRHTLAQHAHIIFRGRAQNYTFPHTFRPRENRYLSSHMIMWSSHHRAIFGTTRPDCILMLACIHLLSRVLTTDVVRGFVRRRIIDCCHRSTYGGETSIYTLCLLSRQSRSSIVDGFGKQNHKVGFCSISLTAHFGMSRNKPQTLVDALRFFGNLHVACQTKTPFYMRIAQHSIDGLHHLLGIFCHTSSLHCYSFARRIIDHKIIDDGHTGLSLGRSSAPRRR